MLKAGTVIPLTVEKPAAGGRMIARVDGEVVLVQGTIPGEQVVARIERVAKGVAYADTVTVEQPSPDRVPTAGDPLCGGCLYAHIAEERQRALKAQVIADAFARIARAPLPATVGVMASPADGYRMRARLHRRGPRLGFFREGTHDLCDARQTRQLLPATCDLIERLAADLVRIGVDEVGDVELAENADASERVVHLHCATPVNLQSAAAMASLPGFSGITLSEYGGSRLLFGSAYVNDRVDLGEAGAVAVRRHVLAFFQGNRFLLRDLVAHVVAQVPEGSSVLDLYAGGGLFAVSAARARHARVTAVEGDRVAAEDLVANAVPVEGVVSVRHIAVEDFLATAPGEAGVVIVDPPRTGLSREALAGVVRLAPERVIYVSCDVATLARDTRQFLESAYRIGRIDAFDLFPATPHVETVVVFDRS